MYIYIHIYIYIYIYMYIYEKVQKKLGTRSISLYLSLNEDVKGEGTEYISSDNYLYDKNET